MKKNYNYPKTEEVQLNGCSIMGGSAPASNGTPMGDPDEKVGPWD